jgi:predicted DCC family thiol-disulfide oxidoreductase YuxK
VIKALLDGFWFSAERPGRELFAKPREEWERAKPLIRAFYGALFFFACWNFDTSIERFDSMSLDPLWPLSWMGLTGAHAGIRMVVLLFVAGPLAAIWRPESRAFRFLAFLGVLEGMALDNSFGKINNHLHLWTSVAFLFLFLPGARDYRNPSPSARAAAVRVFWGAQALVLLTYTMSGIAKLLGAAVQIRRGDGHHLFSLDALARHVSERLLQTGEHSLVGGWLIDHVWLGPPLLLGAVYLETFALWAAFRPSLHRPWGLGLICMHLGIMLAMNITFSHSMLLLALLFLGSPFTAPAGSRLGDWPLFGPFLRALRDAFGRPRAAAAGTAGVETLLFYDGSCGICNRWVAFLLGRRIPADLRFATLQGERYAALKSRHPCLGGIDSLVVHRRAGGGEDVLVRSEAVFWLLARLPGWPRLSLPFNLIPMALLDVGYRTVAALRHRFNRGRAACVMPTAAQRALFLERDGNAVRAKGPEEETGI